MNSLDKWNNGNGALTAERRVMNEALSRIAAMEETRRAGRLLFAIDLTASRATALRDARIATAAMFDTLKFIGTGRLALKLVYYRGWGECKASGWEQDSAVLKRAMEKLSCRPGDTQIAKVLRLALAEKEPLSGVVFIGDACEEKPEELYDLAAKLAGTGVPLFMFHDWAGRNSADVEQAAPVFEAMAEWTHGAYCRFGAGSAAALRELLSTVAAFSAGGVEAVKQVQPATTPEALQLQTRLLLTASK